MAGEHSNPIVLKLVTLKDYFLSFQSQEDKLEILLQQRLAAMGLAGTDTRQGPMTNQTQTQPQVQITTPVPDLDKAMEDIAKASLSPIDRDDLTEDEIYDLLSLRPDSKRTDAENYWYLEKGLFIKMRRAGMSIKQSNISEDNL